MSKRLCCCLIRMASDSEGDESFEMSSEDGSHEGSFMEDHCEKEESLEDQEKNERMVQQERCVQILQDMNKLRQEGTLCDVKLIIEGQEFAAHRNVLMSGCSYFRCMFDTKRSMSVCENQKENIEIGNLPASVMDDVLTYIYTGDITANVRMQAQCYDVLVTADFLLLKDLKATVATWMAKNVSCENSISWFQIASILDCIELREKALRLVWENFQSLCKSEEFLGLESELLCDVISSKFLVVDDELDVFDALIYWTQERPGKEHKFAELFTHIQIFSFSEEYIDERVLTQSLVTTSPDCLQWISDGRKLADCDERKRFCHRNMSTGNLVDNPNFYPSAEWSEGQQFCIQYNTEPWIKVAKGGDGYRLEKKPQGSHCLPASAGGQESWCVAGSFSDCRRTQLIDLEAKGIPGGYIDVMRPPIYICEWFAQRNDCEGYYELSVHLLGKDKKTKLCQYVADRDGLQGTGNSWIKVEHTFTDYPPGVRFVKWKDCSRDKNFWQGYYGAKLATPTVCILPFTKTIN